MSPGPARGWGSAIAVALATTLAAIGLVAILRQLSVVNVTSPFIAAIALSAFLAGRRAALVGLLLAALALTTLYADTHGPAALAEGAGIARLVTFYLSAAAVTLVVGALHEARRVAEEQAQENLRLRELAEETAAHAEEETERATEAAALAAEAAEGLRRARNELEAILQGSPLAICSLDPDGKVTTWNRAAERVFGWTADEVIGRLLPNVSPDRQEEFRELRTRVLGGNAFADYETRRMRKDGQELDVLISTAPLHDRAGRIIGLVALYQDLTARKQLEEDLRQAQKMEAVGQLAAGVAHDFNNLLTVIISQCELIELESPAAGASDEVREILAAAARAAHLTRQLLAFSRRQVLNFQVVNLNDVVAGIGTMLQSAVGDQVRLVTRLDPDLTAVRADGNQLEQVLLNLAVNARDAMPAGGSLIIETERIVLGGEHLDPHLGSRTGPHVLLTITDTGVGMDVATQSRIFEPFFTTKAPGRGTGLGLSSAYGVVQQCGGHLSVYSEPGSGTCFRIYLPEYQGPAEQARPTEAVPLRLDRPITVLLVDDDAAVRRSVARLLEGSGLVVLDAAGAQEAIALARDTRRAIDLILSDVAMADLDGIRLLDHLHWRRPTARGLLMSGYTPEAISRLGKPALDLPLLVKPFSRDALLQAISHALAEPPREPMRSVMPPG